MKSQFLYAMCLFSVVFSGSVFGFDVFDSNYTWETYATYPITSAARGTVSGMTFDADGNLYLLQRGINLSAQDSGIFKIDSSRTVSLFASGLNAGGRIVYGGGTSYGDYLYVTDFNSSTSRTYGSVMKVGMDSTVRTFNTSIQSPFAVTIFECGGYGDTMYIANLANDHLYSLSTTGTASLFSSFPDDAPDGIKAIAFDYSGKYGGGMYVCGSSTDENYDGIFSISATGEATLFSNPLYMQSDMAFGSDEFDNDMFITGVTVAGGVDKIFHVDTDGNVTLFAEQSGCYISSFIFGPDGSMYTAYNDSGIINVIRINEIPEPCTIALLGFGAVMLRRRK